jgi:hypothetical protein
MRYMIKSDKSVFRHGTGRVVVVMPTSTDEGSDSVGIMIDVVCVNGLLIKLAMGPADFADEASCVQLELLAARIQLMVTAASNLRSSAEMETRDAGGGVP